MKPDQTTRPIDAEAEAETETETTEDIPTAPRIDGRRVLDTTHMTETERIELLESAHTFPGLFPVVVIAERDEAFYITLQATLAAEQGEAPFHVRRRLSRHGNYVSYHIELQVVSAAVAMQRQLTLAALPGIRTLF